MPRKTTRPSLAEALRQEAQVGNDLEVLAGLADPRQPYEVLPSFSELAKQMTKRQAGVVRIPLPREA